MSPAEVSGLVPKPAVPPGGARSTGPPVESRARVNEAAAAEIRGRGKRSSNDDVAGCIERDGGRIGIRAQTFGCSSRPDAHHRPFERPPGGNGTTLCNVTTSA